MLDAVVILWKKVEVYISKVRKETVLIKKARKENDIRSCT